MIALPPDSAALGLYSGSPVWKDGPEEVGKAHKRLDPERQRYRVPVRLISMLSARGHGGQHPEYLHPLPSTPSSPIELDAKKSPLALLAQTCSQIGKPDPPSSSKNQSSTKESKSTPLKISDIGAEDKSSFKPYSKSPEKKSSPSSGDKCAFRVPSTPCRPFTPGTSSGPSSPQVTDSKAGDRDETKESEGGKTSPCEASGTVSLSSSETTQHREAPKPSASEAATVSSAPSALGSGLVAPVSPYRLGHTVFPLAPTGVSFPGGLAGAYAGYPQHFLSHGVTLDPSKSSSQLISAHLAATKTGTSPLSGASPPSIISAGLCRDPYCLSYHCASHLQSGAGTSSTHHPLFPSHPLSGIPSSTTLPAPSLYPYGFMLPNDPQPHACNWVSANGPCDKRFSTSEELLSHLRTHTAFMGTDKSLGYPGSSSLAAAMACHVPNGGPGGPLGLRTPHPALGLIRYHPYSKSPLPTPGAAGSYYAPYGLYGQRLTTAPGLSYQ